LTIVSMYDRIVLSQVGIVIKKTRIIK